MKIELSGATATSITSESEIFWSWGWTIPQYHTFMGSCRLEKTFKIIQFNHKPNTAKEELNRNPARDCQCKQQKTIGLSWISRLWSKSMSQENTEAASFAFCPSKAKPDSSLRQGLHRKFKSHIWQGTWRQWVKYFLYEKLTHKLNQACSFMLLVKYIILQLLISSTLIQYLVLLEPGIKIFQKPSSAKDFLIAHFCLIRSLTT